MMLRLAAVLLAFLLLCGAARSETLVVDLSSDRIEVTSAFQGTRITLFGVIERDLQTVARHGPYDIVVVVKGPREDVLVQRSGRRFGIWVNVSSQDFRDIPSYYGLFTTPAPSTLVDEWLADVARPDDRTAAPFVGTRSDFFHAVNDFREARGVWVRRIGGVEMLTDRFFRAVIPLPDIAKHGSYDVTVYLFADGAMLDTDESQFEVAKVGFEQQLFELSRQSPLAYGVAVVALALVTGYVGGVVFHRN